MFFCYVFLLALLGKITIFIYYSILFYFAAKIEQSMTKESSPKHKKWLPNEKGLAAVNLCYEQRTLLKTSRRTKCLIHLLHGTFYIKRGKGRCYKIIILSLLVVSFVHKARERHVANNLLLRVLVHFRAVLWDFLIFYKLLLFLCNTLYSRDMDFQWFLSGQNCSSAQVLLKKDDNNIIIDCLTALCIIRLIKAS